RGRLPLRCPASSAPPCGSWILVRSRTRRRQDYALRTTPSSDSMRRHRSGWDPHHEKSALRTTHTKASLQAKSSQLSLHEISNSSCSNRAVEPLIDLANDVVRVKEIGHSTSHCSRTNAARMFHHDRMAEQLPLLGFLTIVTTISRSSAISRGPACGFH